MHTGSTPFDWADARYFHRYAMTGSLVQTAEYFGTSRYTVSRALKRFQSQHPLPLYWRHRSTLTLTEAGKAIWTLLDEAFTQAQQIELKIQALSHRPVEVIIGLPSIAITPWLFEQLDAFAKAQDIRLVFSGETTPDSIAAGLPHLGVFLDRPTAHRSIAPEVLIGGSRLDVEHALYRAKTPSVPYILVGGYSDVEWHSIVHHRHFDLDYSRHGTLCQPLSEVNREQLARLGTGIVALPTAGKLEDGTLEELTVHGRFPLYSLHLTMHPAYRHSETHRLVRAALVALLDSLETSGEAFAQAAPVSTQCT